MNYENVDFSLIGTYPRYRPAKTELKKLDIEENKQTLNPTIEINEEDKNDSASDPEIQNSPEIAVKISSEEPINAEEIYKESQQQEKLESQWNSIESKLRIFKSLTFQKFTDKSTNPKSNKEEMVLNTILDKLEQLFIRLGNNDFNDFLLFQFSTYLSVFKHKGQDFEGFFDQKFESGFGVVKTPRFKYIGSIVNKNFEGLGAMIHEGGGLYIGNWRQGKREGYGRYTWPDGAEYNGNFCKGDMEGNGTFMYTNQDLFKGEFKDNVRNGKGRYFYKNSSYLDFDEGEWKDGEMTGKAMIVRKGEEKEITIQKKNQ